MVGEAAGARQLWRALRSAEPDVVLIDFALEGVNGVILCHRLKRRPDAPRVVLYSAFADRALIAPPMLARADAFLSKRADARMLCQVLREVAARRPACSGGRDLAADSGPEQRPGPGCRRCARDVSTAPADRACACA